MTGLGEVFETVHDGQRRFSTLRGTVREWRHFPRGRKAFARVMSRSGTPPEEASLVAEAPEQAESRLRLWVAKPGRMRLERDVDGGAAVTVVDGERWWSYHPVQGYEASAERDRAATPTTLVLQALLYPWDLLGSLALEIAGESQYAGRDAWVLKADPPAHRGRTSLLGLGQGADGYELGVDREFGLLLRTAALTDGEAFDVKEFLDLSLDADLPEDAFTFPA